MAEKKINKALLELWLGILFLGIMFQCIGMWFVKDKGTYTIALWIGISMALFMVWHMCRTLEKVLELGAVAQKKAISNNIIRYGMILITFAVVTQIKILNPLIVFMGLMSVKAAVYIQPITHKLCNKICFKGYKMPENV